jgi:NADH dehydrogenase
MLEEASVEARDARGGVLILGGGFAGAYVARLLGERGATIVSRENFMLYTPLLPEAASGTLEPRHTVVPLRVMCPHAELLIGDVSAIDLETRAATIGTSGGERDPAHRAGPGARRPRALVQVAAGRDQPP